MYEHGGDWAGFASAYGKKPLDFSASLSPLGVPAGVRAAVIRSLEDCGAYPDPECRALRQALGEKLGVLAKEILCGNGASDLIWRLCMALRPRVALVTAPCFSEYAYALYHAGSTIRSYPLTEESGFRLGADFPERITPETDLVILSQPNNPTGVTVPRALLLEILAACEKSGAVLLLDECFLEFLQEPENMTLLPCLARRNLVLLRAFTKLHGMAGLRLGYCLSANQPLLHNMAQAGPPWSVSVPAQAGGLAALEEDDYVNHLRQLIPKERQWLLDGLRELGLTGIPGEANFLLFRGPEDLGERLREKGILLRDCRSFSGLGPGWYRTAVREETDNRRLLGAIGEVLAWQSES